MKQLYYSFSQYLKDTFGRKLYKAAFEAGMTCPNRDGTLDTRGCIFCGEGGSGDFAVHYEGKKLRLKELVYNHRNTSPGDFIAYFQSFTNTYAPIERLYRIFSSALQDEMFAGISIATRPDCVSDEVVALLKKLKEEYSKKFIWVELGLQTVHEETARWMRRGYPLPVFDECVEKLNQIQIPVIAHVIIGLPKETEKMLLETIGHLNHSGISGIKLQLLHYLKSTDLGRLYTQHPENYHVLTMEEYVDLIVKCIAHLRQDIVIHRLTGDGNADMLLAPLWSRDKRRVLNSIHHELKVRRYTQGCLF